MDRKVKNLEYVIDKKRTFSRLWDEYGNPGDVKKHLLSITESHPWIAVLLKKDIANLEEEDRRWREAEEEQLLIIEIEKQNPCYSCGFGDGMGRCGIGAGIECAENEEWLSKIYRNSYY